MDRRQTRRLLDMLYDGRRRNWIMVAGGGTAVGIRGNEWMYIYTHTTRAFGGVFPWEDDFSEEHGTFA